MDINAAFTSKHLKASDLQGRDVTVKMARVEQEKIGDDQKLVLYFQGKERGMVLNKTNANAIADIYGPETADWYGQPIVIFEQMVDFQGKRVPGLRVRAARQAPVQRQVPVENYEDDNRPIPPRRDPISTAPQRMAVDPMPSDEIPF